MAIKPFTYDSAVTPTASVTPAAPIQPTTGGRIKPYTYTEPVKPSLTPAEQGLVDRIPKPPAPPSFLDKVKSFLTPFGGAAPKPSETNPRPGTIQTLPPVTIKAPFVNAGITFPHGGVPEQLVGGLVEWPERLARSIGQYGQVLATGKYTPQTKEPGKYTVDTTLESMDAFREGMVKNGMSETQASWIAGLYGGSAGALDLLGLEGILQKGVAKVAAQSAIDPAELNAAKTLLGNPSDLKAAETQYRNIQKMAHPDMPGANAKLSQQASQAIEIVRKADKEGILGTVARGAAQAQKPLSELFGVSKPAPKPPTALLPETTGKIQPFDYSKPVSTEIPPKAVETPGIPAKPAVVPKPVESPVIPAAPAVEGVAAPVVTPEPTQPRKLTVVPEDTTNVPKVRVQGPGNTLETPLNIGGARVPRPAQIVTKSDLKGLADTLPGKEADFTVVEQNGTKYMSFDNKGTKMLLRPSALGLVEDNLRTGDTLKISKEVLKAPGRSLRAKTEEDTTVADLGGDLKEGNVNPAKSVDELKKKIDQLNKFGQQYSILRRTGNVPKNAYGVFRSPAKKGKINAKVRDKGEVGLQNEVVGSPRQYMSTLSHELGHALEYTMTGKINAETLKVFGKNLTPAEEKEILDELKAITNSMVGEANAKAGAGYYYQKTELLARFLQRMFEKPGEVADLAPKAVAALEKSAIENPIIQEYLDAVYGNIDKGERKHIFLRDMKQTYQKVLGTRVGEMAWNDEMRYRAMKERAKIQVEKLIKDKFKNVKDAPDHLFRAAESIKVTEKDAPVFGTRDFQYAKNDAEAAKLMLNGWEPILDDQGKIVTQLVDGKLVPRFAKPRYTPEEGKRLFDSLSPEGQRLVKDFTATRDEAKDYFNREVIKDVHQINSDLEGWVHRYWEEKGTGIGGDKLKVKIASSKKHRAGAEGYVQDLQKAMQKALTELETTKAYNAFIDDYFARVSKPIEKGAEPDPGWVEVQGDVRKSGIGRPGEVKKIIIGKEGKGAIASQARYQMPAEIYQRFQMIRELAVEASTAARVMNDINRYWRVNILFYPGSSATNFVSGALQYSTKVLTDFYVEALTGSAQFPKTRRNIFSMITAASPKGWQAAPDWIYGGDLSNFYGEFMSAKSPGTPASEAVDFYGDHALKFYGNIERYWKKVIALSEDASKLGSLNKMDKEGLRLPTEEEKALLDEINKEIDLFAYDYDNVPIWLEKHQQNVFGQAVKPFAKYFYKFTKQVTEMVHQAFDETLPWQERAAKIMALSTVIALYAAASERRKHQQKTPEVGENAPPSVSTRGRLFIGTDKEGNEMFTRVAKYPFLNLSEAGLQVAHGHADTALQIIQDMIGSIAPVGDVGAAMMGYSNQYQTYQPTGARIGQDLATFVPASRMLKDIARFFDPYQRKQTTFLQGFTSMYPTTDEALQEKLHGAIKTIQVPLEEGISPQAGEGTKHTTTDMYVKNYKMDVLLGLLAGLYMTRIDPQVAEAFNTRAQENAEKAKKKAEKDALQKLVKP